MSTINEGWNARRVLRMVLPAGVALLAVSSEPMAQQTCKARMEQDPSLNNLVHAEGYRTAKEGALGGVIREGNGPVDMILIAGAGFGGEVFEAFMQANVSRYRMLAVTLPGFGGTPAPPMPPAGTSYGLLSWTRGAQEALARLIETEGLKLPVVVGHWLGATPVALGLAVERPDLVGGAVVISGVPRFVPMSGAGMVEPASVQQRIAMVDQYLAPQWFRTVTRETWDDNNFLPRDYAIHPLRALQLWRVAADPPLPVWIRYLCESWAQDSTARLAELQVPVLILKPGFDPLYHQGPQLGDYMEALTHRGWGGVEELSGRIGVETIADARVFIMDDQPERLDEAVERFVSQSVARASRAGIVRPAPRAPEIPEFVGAETWGGSVRRDGDRYILTDAGLSIERPDRSWELEAVVQKAPLVARMRDAEGKSEVTVQVRPTMGMGIDALLPMVESGLAQQLPDYEKVSAARDSLAGRDAFRIEFRHRKAGEMIQTIMIATALDGMRMLSVSFSAPPAEFDLFRPAFERIGRSVALIAAGG